MAQTKIIGGSGKKKDSKRSEPRINVFLKKVPAEIKIDKVQKTEKSMVFLNDLSTNGVGIFLEHKLPQHASIALIIQAPKYLYVKGKVMWCNRFNYDSKVLSSNKFIYRAGIKFKFNSDKEKEEVESYINSLRKSLSDEYT